MSGDVTKRAVDRMVSARKLRGFTQEYVAEFLGVKPTTYANWEQGRSAPSVDTIYTLCSFYDESFDEWLGLIPKPSNDKQEPIRIRVLGRVPAGVPLEAIEEVLDWEDLDPRGYTPNSQFFGLRVMGDSMYPEYLDGDTIIVEQSTSAETGQDVVAYVNGYDATLKKFIRYENGSIELRPINPNYQTTIFTATQAEEIPVQILGFVRELRRKK